MRLANRDPSCVTEAQGDAALVRSALDPSAERWKISQGAAVSSAVDKGDSKAVDEALEVQSDVHEPVHDAAVSTEEECDLFPGQLAVTDAPPAPPADVIG
ncbi:hypothetical protein NQZ68_000116 [Dissostichus eleginoides]|nr:hypothetical protein NQZ68_000116 [Dissostichus eleginoides]